VTRFTVLVVAKTTSYRTYVEEQRDPRTTALLASGDPAVRRLRGSHEEHEATRAEVHAAVRELGVNAEFVSAAQVTDGSGFDLVITIGGDGTLLRASHAVGAATPILGVNSAPSHSVGFFCGAEKGGVLDALRSALGGRMPRTVLSRMRVDLNGRCLHERVLNDALFCHEVPAATSRYILTLEQPAGRAREEEQKSSGIWVGPAAGSTAAQRSAGGRVLPLTSHRIQYVVREPYTPRGNPLKLSCGTIGDGARLVLRSKMRQARLFLDGPHLVHPVALGDVLTLRRSDEPLTVLGLSRLRGATPAPPTDKARRRTR